MAARIDASEFPDYDPRWTRRPWSGHRHTVSAFLSEPDRGLGDFPSRRFEVPALDDSGDRLIVQLLRPRGVSLDATPDCPLVVLLHGLGGHADSGYMRRTALHLLDHGHDVLLFNFRGAGASAGTCSKHHHPGRSEDIAALFKADLGRAPDIFACGAVPVAFSLGGSVLLKFLGEGGCPQVRAAVTVSAPLDLQATSRRLGRIWNLPYRAYLLAKLRYRLRTDPDGLSEKASRRIRWTTSIWDFDRRFTAPRNGYDSVEAYYADNSCASDLPNVRVPTYLLHADDDPFVPADRYHDYEWGRNARLVPMLTRSGGHVGFVERDGGLWHNRCIAHLMNTLQ